MNRTRLAKIGALLVAILAVVATVGLIETITSSRRNFMGSKAIVSQQVIQPINPATPVEPAEPVELTVGNFVTGEAPTSGTFRIVQEGLERYLELSPSFRTREGEELKLLFAPESVPPRSYANVPVERYRYIAPLQAPGGAQRYPIPDEVNLDDYQSVVISSVRDNATVGYAPLKLIVVAPDSPATTTATTTITEPVIPAESNPAPAALW